MAHEEITLSQVSPTATAPTSAVGGAVVSEDEVMEPALKHEDHAEMIMPPSLMAMTQEDRDAMNKRIVRKMDLVLMPIIAVLYILNYIDRQALAASKLQGIMEDLNMSTQQFATAVSILYAGYIPFQTPSNLVIARLPRPGLYICCATVLWGCVSASTAAVSSYGSLLAVRVVLGATEAVFFPGVMYFLSAWYTKVELGKRFAGVYIFQQLGGGFGGLLAAGILHLDGAHGIRGWKWLFIVEGVATIGFGLIFAFIMPEYPHNARLLTPVEREMAVWRIEQEAGAGEAREDISAMKGLYLVLTDIKLWALVFCSMMSTGMGTISNFFPTIVGSLGYNPTITLLLTAPPYVFACFFFYALMYYSDRKNVIYPLMLVCLGMATVVYIIALATLNTGARYFCMMMLPSVGVGPQILLYKTLNLHLARPFKKRAAGSALLNCLGTTANIWGSYLYYGPPHFYAAFGGILGCTAAFAVTITFYKWYVLRENKKLASGDPAKIASAMKGGVTQEQIDMGWRYEQY